MSDASGIVSNRELHRVLGPHADEFAAAAESADDPETAAALATLAALARDEDVPPSARRHLTEWLGGR